MVDDGLDVFIKRVVREATDADVILFVVDTPGGLLDSGIEITKTIQQAPCATIAYVTGMGAISAGALISLACDDIIMAPDSTMGAATPVLMSTEGPVPTSEKEVSFMRAKMRALAEANGHNAAIAEAMVDKDIELRAYRDEHGALVVFAAGRAPEPEADESDWTEGMAKSVRDAVSKAVESLRQTGQEPATPDVPAQEEEPDNAAPPKTTSAEDSELVLASGKLLTLTAQEALDYGVIPAIAEDVDAALAHYGYEGLDKIEMQMTWSEALFRWLTSPIVSGLLLMLGIAGLYMEFKTPGFGLFGIVGLCCLALFFGSHLVIGLANWIDLLLVVVGISLIAVEIFVIPGFGLAGIAGIACLLAGLYMTLTHTPIPEYSWDFARLHDAGISFLTAFALSVLLIILFWRVLPRTPLFGWLVLGASQQADEGYVVQTESDREQALGLEGVALTLLRPVGRGRFGQRNYAVMARSEYIPKGARIKIVKVEGNRYVVERIQEGSETPEEDSA